MTIGIRTHSECVDFLGPLTKMLEMPNICVTHANLVMQLDRRRYIHYCIPWHPGVFTFLLFYYYLGTSVCISMWKKSTASRYFSVFNTVFSGTRTYIDLMSAFAWMGFLLGLSVSRNINFQLSKYVQCTPFYIYLNYKAHVLSHRDQPKQNSVYCLYIQSFMH